jgi:hypothetical protein
MTPITDRLLAAAVRADTENPIAGLRPSFAFGAEFGATWQKLVTALWGLAIIATIVFILVQTAKMSAAGDNMQMHAQSKTGLVRALIALGIEVALSAIVAAVLFVAG